MVRPATNNTREDEQAPLSDQHPRNLRQNSFIDRYGVDEVHLSATELIQQYLKKQRASWSCIGFLNACLERIPLIRCLKEYQLRRNLFGDLIAGITVAIMHIPQGMAYGVLTGLPPVHGQ